MNFPPHAIEDISLAEASSGNMPLDASWATATLVTSSAHFALKCFAAFFVLEGLSWVVAHLLDIYDDLSSTVEC